MAKNNLYTKSYFKKRLREAGIRVSDVAYVVEQKDGESKYANVKFDDKDTRYWLVLIDGGRANIECTCIRSGDETMFTMVYPNQAKITIKTKSMATIIENLNMVIEDWKVDDVNSID